MRKAYVKISKKQSSTEFIRGLARGDLYALVWDIIRTDSWRRRRNVSIPWWDKNLLMWWNTMVVRFVGSCEINPAPMNVNKNSRFVRLQIPPHSAPRTYWVTDWLTYRTHFVIVPFPLRLHISKINITANVSLSRYKFVCALFACTRDKYVIPLYFEWRSRFSAEKGGVSFSLSSPSKRDR